MANLYGPRIVTDGLVLCLDAANRKSYPGSGSTWYDLSGNGYHGTIQGATFSNNAFNFDGTDDYIDLDSHASNLIFNAPATMNFWFKATNNISVGGRLYSTSNGEYDLNTDNVDYFNVGYGNFTTTLTNEKFSVGKGVNQQNPEVASTVNIYGVTEGVDPQNKWYNMCVTTQSGSWQIYVNGVLQNLTRSSYWQGNIFGYGEDISSKTNVTIGALRRGSQVIGVFQGSIVHTSLHNRLLSSDEILQNYNALKGRFGL